MITALLVDDEPIALKRLASIITKSCPQVKILDNAKSVREAIEQIRRLKPELVFLDIELAGSSSFEILDDMEQRNFELIFVTAYDDFGIRALKHEAIDYVLKPINRAELINAIEKATKKIYQKRGALQTPNNNGINKPQINRLALPTMEGLVFVDIDKIMYCESEGRYTRFFLAEDDKKILVSKNLGEYEASLSPNLFIRIHNSSLVNFSYIEKYVKGRGGYVILRNGKILPVSSRRKDDFFDKLE